MIVEAPRSQEVTDSETGTAERRLWLSALALLLADARAYWHCKQWRGGADYELEAAFDDVCRAGPMLRHLCGFTGHAPEWISQGFTAWCESH